MAKSRYLQSNFTSGELSPFLKGRTDLEQYYFGLESAENVVIVPQGGVKRRPGTRYQDTAEASLNFRSTSGSNLTITTASGISASILNYGPTTNDEVTTEGDTAIGTTNPYVVAKYAGDQAGLPVKFIDVVNISLFAGGSGSSSTQFKVQGSNDDATWTTIDSIPLVDTTPRTYRFGVDVNYQYYRLARVGSTDLGLAKLRIAQFNLFTTFAPSQYNNTKTFDLSVSRTEKYLLVMTDGNLRIYNAGSGQLSHDADVRIPYTNQQIPDVRDANTEGVIILFHEEHPSIRIFKQDGEWNVSNVPYANIPDYDFNDTSSPTPVAAVQTIRFHNDHPVGMQFQIDVEGVLSRNITYAAGASGEDAALTTAFNIQEALQSMPKFGDTGIEVIFDSTLTWRITMDGESANDYLQFTAFQTSEEAANHPIACVKVTSGRERTEPVWGVHDNIIDGVTTSVNRGYPRLGAFFEGRLWLGGTRDKPQSLFASRIGNFFDYFIEDSAADEAIFVTLSAREFTEIIDVMPQRGLQLFCAGGEFSVTGSTPVDISIQSQSQHGSSYIEVKSLDGATLFIDENGKTLRQYLYSFNEDAFQSNDISVLSSHLLNDPVDLAVLPGTSDLDANYVVIINKDGSAAILNTLRSQNINGYTKWTHKRPDESLDKIISASVVGNKIYFVTQRALAGYVTAIEEWDFDRLTDSAVVYLNPSAGFLSGLDHLEGKEVSLVGDGTYLGTKTVSSGLISITAEEADYSELEVGLNFVPTVKGMPIATNAGSGVNVMRDKRIIRMNLRVYESSGVTIDGNTVPVRSFGDASNSPLNNPFPKQTGIIEDNHGGKGWGIDVQPEITSPNPAPFHLQAIEYEVESS